MSSVQTQDERRKAALDVGLVVLFLFQIVVATIDLLPLDLQSPDIIDQPCTYNCIDSGYENSDLSPLLLGEGVKFIVMIASIALGV